MSTRQLNVTHLTAVMMASVPSLHAGSPTQHDARENFIADAKNGFDSGFWAHHVPDAYITLQLIGAIAHRSALDDKAKLAAITAAINVAINDAADRYIGDEEADAADYLKNKEIDQ